MFCALNDHSLLRWNELEQLIWPVSIVLSFPNEVCHMAGLRPKGCLRAKDFALSTPPEGRRAGRGPSIGSALLKSGRLASVPEALPILKDLWDHP